MNTRIGCLLLASALFAGSASATLIASESFATWDGDEGYQHQVNFDNAAHRANLLGTTGFSAANQWQSGTALVQPRNPSLTHDLVVGGTSDGRAHVRTVEPQFVSRHSRRALAEEPSGSTFL